MATDFLAFDRACGAALEFARNNGETAVVIVPDHGNSGISLGRKDCKGYDKLTKDQLFHQFSLYKLTAEGFANKVNSVPNSEVQNVFRTYAGFELTPEEMNALNNCKDYKNSPIPEDQRKPEDNSSMYSGSLTGLMSHFPHLLRFHDRRSYGRGSIPSRLPSARNLTPRYEYEHRAE